MNTLKCTYGCAQCILPILLWFFTFSSQLGFLTLWIDCITSYQFFDYRSKNCVISFSVIQNTEFENACLLRPVIWKMFALVCTITEKGQDRFIIMSSFPAYENYSY